MNTLSDIKRVFDSRHWIDCSYSCDATPTYGQHNYLTSALVEQFQKHAPSAMDTVIMVFLQRR